MRKIAVISADLVNSSKYEELGLVSSINTLEEPEGQYLSLSPKNILTSRGDSFQIMMEDWENAFLKTIFLKAYFKKQTLQLKGQSQKKNLDVRISLAVGLVDKIPEDIGKTMEEPFVISGRALDKMKEKAQSIIINTNNQDFNRELELECAMLQYILDGWTIAQAEVIYYLVQGLKQTEIAEKLGLTQPSVSNRIQLANWTLIEKMNKRYKEIMSKI